jgi:3-deoxy-7-phosphoheptulonate synthase
MIIVMKREATAEHISDVIKRIEELGFRPHLLTEDERTIIGFIGGETGSIQSTFSAMSGVERVVVSQKPYRIASRESRKEGTIVKVGDVRIGAFEIVIMAGPCAVESRTMLMEVACAVKEAGAKILRGGAYKPRTSPYSFKGLKEKGLEILADAKQKTGLAVVTEVISAQDVKLVSQYADILQIGARNMQNFTLLEEVGNINKPVLLKRGMMATLEELLMAAEYILSSGNSQVILCERGIRTFEKYTRNTLDIVSVPLLKELTHLPVIVDPSHGTGVRSLVKPASMAAVAAGADGLLIEVHPNPDEALSDGPQSLCPEDFRRLVKEVKRVAEAVGRGI